MTSSLTGKGYVGAFGLPLPEVLIADCPHAWRHARAGENGTAFATRLAADLDALIEKEPEHAFLVACAIDPKPAISQLEN